ncbi:phospho-sugar mutase [Actinospica durhamensis]|uniref:Phospho-sugar mutase n=1 Tax=Actinospica durhamensis TaxID=1508375 RepID=A0A941ELW0_9ACTN|nr:phospho-sugar mutase [Actinospica durhamensis]MBR7834062.1 phospho-sugar mutase [Actinospica durhamensis]
MSEISELLEEVEAWLDQDPDEETRAELHELLEGLLSAASSSAAYAELADRFDGTLEFGTAGLRGELGAGPNRMNRVVVTRAAAGLAAYLKANGHVEEPVVIGYDARKNSDVFARDTAEILTGAGLRAQLLPRPLPTPVLAFAIRHLGACAGVMVTASHNPPQDNGYKVYLGEGSQIVPPADADIAAAIAAVGSIKTLPRGNGDGEGEDWETLDETLLEAYLNRAVGIVEASDMDEDAAIARRRALKVVSTALHGVGGAVLGDAFEHAGFLRPVAVPEQQEPDPTFHTVAFPNPEEPGAIDLALALAEAEDADLVVANDPDADRCAVAVPLPGGGWRMLRGDEVGGLLGEYLAAGDGAKPDEAQEADEAADDEAEERVFATSIVSSSLLGKIAAAHGLGYQETLTGFKWLAKVPGLAFGYEEALGYCVDPGAVRDKDGITAALAVAEYASKLKQAGRTLLDALADLDAKYGPHRTDQLSLRVSDLAVIPRIMATLRQDPPKELGGLAVTRFEDLAEGGQLPPTDGLRFTLEGGARVIVRPSGTEPKLKCYLEADSAERLAAIKESLQPLLEA